MGGQVGEGGTLLTDAAQFFLFVPIPAKAKKLGLISIYLFSLVQTLGWSRKWLFLLTRNS
jgi:hypothetical protein